MHIPVLLNEVIDLLKPEAGEFFIDGTVDGGGHSTEILRKISPGGTLLGVDWDEAMIEKTRQKISEISKSESLISKQLFLHGNYADLPEIIAEKKLPKADALLLDLGFSSEQLESSGRGFSFNPQAAEEPLLMIYDNSSEPVKDLLKRIDEKELADIIFRFGGERFSRKIAAAIKQSERKKKIETAGELNEIVKNALPKNYEHGRIEPATRTFQALRIYANHELKNLERILKELPKVLKPGGRAAIISFHSLEDKIVKDSFRELSKEGKAEILTSKPVRPARKEILENSRSRSAMLRAAVLKTDN